MSYTVLARKYRSSTFDEVIGQDHVARTLKRAIESGRIAHAFLFCGTRGVGKTSMARILAKALNCLSADAPTPQPCGKCDLCKGVARGDDMDVVEIDAASNTQVDKTRQEIIDNAQYRPLRCRYKIYIIDEVHMLSKASFNALLKTLEEPPEHVKFILATTEPEKVLPTILSRCQRYDFRNIPTREIAEHLKEVCKKEKVKADDDALLLVAKAGAGSMRDSLSLLDRLLSLGEKTLDVGMIEQLLGLPRSQLIFDLAQSIGEGDVPQTLGRADGLINNGLSPDSLIASLIDHLRNLLILRTCGAESKLVEVPGLSPAQMNQQAAQFDPAALSQDIVVLEELRRQMRQSQAGRALLDATLVRLALAEQFASVDDLIARLNGSGSPGGAATAGFQKKKFEPPVDASVESPAAVPPAAPPAAFAQPVAEADEDDDLPRPGKVWEGPSLKELLAQQKSASPAPPPASPAPVSPAADASNVEDVDPSNLPAVWQAMLNLLSDKGMGLAASLSHARLVGMNDGKAVIRFSRQADTFVKLFERNGKKELVRDALGQVLKQPIGVTFESEPGDDATATSPATATAAAEPRPSPVRREVATEAYAPPPPAPPRLTPELRETAERDPLVRAILDELGGTIVKVE